jgi:hypothetical protein
VGARAPPGVPTAATYPISQDRDAAELL